MLRIIMGEGKFKYMKICCSKSLKGVCILISVCSSAIPDPYLEKIYNRTSSEKDKDNQEIRYGVASI